MTDGVITLGQLVGRLEMVDIVCDQCERRGRRRVSRLIAEHGAEASLPALRRILAGDCPRLASTSIYDGCGVHFPQLPRLF